MDSHGGLQQRRAASVEKEAGGVWEPFLEVNKERRGVWWICVGRGVKGFYTEAVQTQELCDFLLFFLYLRSLQMSLIGHTSTVTL